MVQFRKVQNITVHDKYNSIKLSHDVAILNLTDPVEMTSRVRDICVAQRPVPAKASACYATGFGIQKDRREKDK